MSELPPEAKKEVDLDKLGEFLKSVEEVPDKKLEEDAKDPVIGSSAAGGFKEFIKTGWEYVKPPLASVSSTVIDVCRSLFEFTKKLVLKKGHVSFTEGFDMGYKDKNSKK